MNLLIPDKTFSIKELEELFDKIATNRQKISIKSTEKKSRKRYNFLQY